METNRSWTVAGGTADDVMDALLSHLEAAGWKDVARRDGTARARFGSRLALRIFGVHLRPGRDRFPMRLSLSTAESGDGVTVDARLGSDEGFYAVRLPAMTRLFERNSAQVLAGLEAGARAA